ncbi:hypothetical protein LNAOJCKE_0959 [Methylorubrum aminovorans]|uniref:Pectate lyase superfamily protein domain-containing protein n=1 Tax=Methylorubrum aminovorans TaxID=269069 RepID=A0ABQ4U8X3_9HYPH|nr:hypothetical protein [Methylorubrum aminovorans]GJE63761.1 hypothetical protein LNAOJCKE_0959 [Methylorubrum aminovorans]
MQILLNAIDAKAPLSNPTFTGTAKADTLQILGPGSTGDISGMTVNGSPLPTLLGQKAPLASPTFTGTVTTPTLSVTGTGSSGRVDGMSVTPSASTTANTLSALLGRTVYITDFMPLGSTDITAALGLAEAKLGAGGGRILLPFSTAGYTITAKHQFGSNVSVEGEGRSAAIITSNFNGDVFAFGDGTETNQNSGVRNVTFRSSITRTSGAAVALRGTFNAKVADITCDVNPYVCVDVYSGPNAFKIHVDRIMVPSAGYVGIRVGFGNPDGGPADVFINEPLISSQTRAGIEIASTGGVQMNGGDLIANQTALLVAPGNGQKVFALYVRGTYLDTSVQSGLKISPTGTGIVVDSQFTDLWAATNGISNGAAGVLVQGTPASVRSVSFNGPRLFNGGGEGFRMEGGAYIDIVNPQIGFNGLFANNTYSGIYVAAGVSNWSVTGGRSGAGTGFTATNQQKYGIEVAPGSGNSFGIVNVDLTGNVTGALSNGATGSNQTVIARGAPYASNGANFGVGTKVPGNLMTIAGPSRQPSDANSGGATVQISSGTGATSDTGIFLGSQTNTSGWMQCATPGSATLPCLVNPNGGAVALGKPAATSTADVPSIPITNGQPTTKTSPVSGMAPMYLDGQANKLCFIIGATTSCAQLTSQ